MNHFLIIHTPQTIERCTFFVVSPISPFLRFLKQTTLSFAHHIVRRVNWCEPFSDVCIDSSAFVIQYTKNKPYISASTNIAREKTNPDNKITNIKTMAEPNPLPVFKKSTLSDAALGNKKRLWKSLKQILAHERTLQWPDNAVTCT